jgi:hypothetical protein
MINYKSLRNTTTKLTKNTKNSQRILIRGSLTSNSPYKTARNPRCSPVAFSRFWEPRLCQKQKGYHLLKGNLPSMDRKLLIKGKVKEASP